MLRKLMRRTAVEEATGYSRSKIYALMAAGEFPAPVHTGAKTVAWVEDEVADWIHAKIDSRPLKYRVIRSRRDAGTGIAA